MALEDVNLEEIERRKTVLQERFGDAPVETVQKSPGSDEFAAWVEMSRDGYVGSAYALVRRTPEQLPALTESMTVDGDEDSRRLLVLPRGGSRWGVPGGGQEGEESMVETVEREVREEVGIAIEPADIRFMRHEITTCEGFAERLHVLRVFFTADYVEGSLSIQAGELNGAAWFTEPPEASRLLPTTQRVLGD